jgi:4-diphosphocytidyl-2-C-methyl-D-erythritol kinase
MKAHAKINLALVVGPVRSDGMHEVVTVLQRIDLHDDVSVEPAGELEVLGFDDDTIVADALSELAQAAATRPAWRATIEKRIPVASGLGGGSSDAAAALCLANKLLAAPLSPVALESLAARVGADVPFFLRVGAQLATGSGTQLAPARLPLDYHVVVLIPHGARKESTGAVYASFDERVGARDFAARADRLREVITRVRSARDLAELPANDLASSPLAEELRRAGAFRADVSGAGPSVYGLFDDLAQARDAAAALHAAGDVFVTRPI